MSSKKISIVLKEEDVKQLKEVARDNDRSVTAQVRRYIKEGIKEELYLNRRIVTK